MGNSKSKKMKITQNDAQKSEESRERINSIKTETADVNEKKSVDLGTEQIEERNYDNASSASTVEVLDDK